METVLICPNLAMRKVILGVSEKVTVGSPLSEMVMALERAIRQTSPTVEIVVREIGPLSDPDPWTLDSDLLFCPLTLAVPGYWSFPHDVLYQTCQNIEQLRQQVEQQLGYPGGVGNYWLPVILTAKGPLYGELIGESQGKYIHPIHVADTWRQPLYELGYRLLKTLQAVPATYLIQFAFQDETLCFDRLWPFPGVPGLATLNTQTPDLFTCHWYCLTHRPLYDLKIASSVPYQIYPKN